MQHLLSSLKQKLGPRQDKVIFAIYLGGAITLAALVIVPAALVLIAVSQQIAAQKASLQENLGGQNSFKEALSSYRLFESKINILNESVLSKNRNLELITALENTAENNNLEQKITVGDYQNIASSERSRMPLQLALRGSFVDELNYLQTLEKMPVYINITKLNFSTPAGNSADINYDVSENQPVSLFITADTFWQ